MWWVYVIEAESGAYYTGVTTDINKRFQQHLGLVPGGAKYFRGNPPSLLLYMRGFKNRSLAQKEECRIKKLSREEKERLLFCE